MFPDEVLEPSGVALLCDVSSLTAAFLSDVSLLDDADDTAQYPGCDAGSVGSAVLVNTTLNTATVAYYTGTNAGSTACFVCDDSHILNMNTV